MIKDFDWVPVNFVLSLYLLYAQINVVLWILNLKEPKFNNLLYSSNSPITPDHMICRFKDSFTKDTAFTNHMKLTILNKDIASPRNIFENEGRDSNNFCRTSFVKVVEESFLMNILSSVSH